MLDFKRLLTASKGHGSAQEQLTGTVAPFCTCTGFHPERNTNLPPLERKRVWQPVTNSYEGD